jgi:Subtilase family
MRSSLTRVATAAALVCGVAVASSGAVAGTTAVEPPLRTRPSLPPAPPATVPTGARLARLLANNKLVTMGIRHDRRSEKLLRAKGARRLGGPVSIWLVPSAKVMEIVSALGTPRGKFIRFIEGPDRGNPVEPLPTPVPYAFTDPLANATYSWHLYAVGAQNASQPGPGFPITVFDSGLDLSHPDFLGRSSTSVLNIQSTSPDDEEGYHGTMVSATAAAATNGVGGQGVYPAAALRSYDFDMRRRSHSPKVSCAPFRRDQVLST